MSSLYLVTLSLFPLHIFLFRNVESYNLKKKDDFYFENIYLAIIILTKIVTQAHGENYLLFKHVA